MFSIIIEEYAEITEDLKESIAYFGPYKMAETLHSLDIMNNISYTKLSNLQQLSKIHLASVLVEELSQDIKKRKKYVVFLNFFKKEPSLAYVNYRIFFLRKFINWFV